MRPVLQSLRHHATFSFPHPQTRRQKMKRKYAPIGLLALGTIGWAPQQASALPNGLPHADHLSDVEQVRWFATRGDGLVAAELLPLVRLLSGSALCPSAFRLAHRGHSRSRQRWLKSHHHRRVFGDTSVTERRGCAPRLSRIVTMPRPILKIISETTKIRCRCGAEPRLTHKMPGSGPGTLIMYNRRCGEQTWASQPAP
jgi:hypothetical protein